jgi:hypothetical protein
MTAADTCWFHSESEYSESGSVPFASRDEAIANAESTYEPEHTFCVHKGRRVTETELATWIASRIRSDCDDGRFEEDAEIGADDPVFEMTATDEAALVPVLTQWARERKVLRCWYRWTESEAMRVRESEEKDGEEPR